jgi:hypothetical protein
VAVLLASLTLAWPSAALAQSTTSPDSDSTLTPTPSVPLPSGSDGNGGNGSTRAPSRGALADTGADLDVMVLLGAVLLLTGLGLRLRTVDDRIF